MDGSFFKRSHWDNPRFHTCFPHRRPDRHRHNHPDGRPEDSPASKSKLAVPVCDDARNEPSKPTSHAKSSVSIPVQCVGTSSQPDALPEAGASSGQCMAKKASSQIGEAAAALKIQSAFRGFSVRKSAPLKNLNVIFQVKAKMEEIRQRIQKPHVVDAIRRNEKERLRISEEIMSLLLTLDAIQGVSSDLREARKSAIRDLVKLQEVVDSIIANKYSDAEADDPAAEGSVMPKIASSTGKNSQPGAPDVAGDVANVEAKFDGSSHRSDQVASTAEQTESVCNGPEDYLETRQNMPCSPLSSESDIAEKTGSPNCRQDAGSVKEHTMENQAFRFGSPQRDGVPPSTEKDNTNCADISKKIDRISRLQAERDPEYSICLDREPDDSISAEEGGKDLICSADEAHQKQETCLKRVAESTDEFDNGKWRPVESKGRAWDGNPAVGMSKDEKKDNCAALEGIGEAMDDNAGSEVKNEAIERVIEDNERLKKMVADQCQRNDMQNNMISNLKKRIEKLEKRILQSYGDRKRMDRRRKKKNAKVQIIKRHKSHEEYPRVHAR